MYLYMRAGAWKQGSGEKHTGAYKLTGGTKITPVVSPSRLGAKRINATLVENFDIVYIAVPGDLKYVRVKLEGIDDGERLGNIFHRNEDLIRDT